MSPIFLNQNAEPKVYNTTNSIPLTGQNRYRGSNLKDINQEILAKLKEEEIWKEAMFEQAMLQEKSFYKLTKKYDNQEILYQDLLAQLHNQAEINKKLADKLEIQEIFHKTIMDQLEKQEALNHKIIRQLDHLKAVLYERVTHIIEKIDFNYKQVVNSLLGTKTKKMIVQREVPQNQMKDKSITK